jgi:hypothetical protein
MDPKLADGLIPVLWLNLMLYGALLLLSCVLRPEPLCRSFALSSHRRRRRAHALIVLFASSRTAWAAYLLRKHLQRVHDGLDPDLPCSLSSDLPACDHGEFLWDNTNSLTLVAAAVLVSAQVATVLLSGFRSSRRLWALVRLALACELAYLFVMVAVASSPSALPAFAFLVHSTLAVFGALYLLVALALVALGTLYRLSAPASLLRPFRVVRLTIPLVFVAAVFFFMVRAASLLVSYSRGKVQISGPALFWIPLLVFWLPELVPSVGLLAMLRSLSHGRAVKLGEPMLCPMRSRFCSAQPAQGASDSGGWAAYVPPSGGAPLPAPPLPAPGAAQCYDRVEVWYTGVRRRLAVGEGGKEGGGTGVREEEGDGAGRGKGDGGAGGDGLGDEGGGAGVRGKGACAELALREVLVESEFCFPVAAAAVALLHAEACAERERVAAEYGAAGGGGEGRRDARGGSTPGVGVNDGAGVNGADKGEWVGDAGMPDALGDEVLAAEAPLPPVHTAPDYPHGHTLPHPTPAVGASSVPAASSHSYPEHSAPTRALAQNGRAEGNRAAPHPCQWEQAWPGLRALGGSTESASVAVAGGLVEAAMDPDFDQTDLLDRLKTELKCERKLPEAAWRRWRLRRMDARLEATAQVLPLLQAAAATGAWPRDRWAPPGRAGDEMGRAADETGRPGDETGRARDETERAGDESGRRADETGQDRDEVGRGTAGGGLVVGGTGLGGLGSVPPGSPAPPPRLRRGMLGVSRGVPCCGGGVLSFKPSTLKEVQAMRHIPTNLHVQSLCVYAAEEVHAAAAAVGAAEAAGVAAAAAAEAAAVAEAAAEAAEAAAVAAAAAAAGWVCGGWVSGPTSSPGTPSAPLLSPRSHPPPSPTLSPPATARRLQRHSLEAKNSGSRNSVALVLRGEGGRGAHGSGTGLGLGAGSVVVGGGSVAPSSFASLSSGLGSGGLGGVPGSELGSGGLGGGLGSGVVGCFGGVSLSSRPVQQHHVCIDEFGIVSTVSGREAAVRCAPLCRGVGFPLAPTPPASHVRQSPLPALHNATPRPLSPLLLEGGLGGGSVRGSSCGGGGENGGGHGECAVPALPSPCALHPLTSPVACARPLGSYSTVTVGAPAAHALGFASGGAWQLQARACKARREAATTEDVAYARYLRRKASQLSDEACARREMCMAQALPALVAVFASRLEQQLRATVGGEGALTRAGARWGDGCGAGQDHSAGGEHHRAGEASGGGGHAHIEGVEASDCGAPHSAAASPVSAAAPAPARRADPSVGCCAAAVIETWRRVGFLVGWQSLLSTYGSEAAMLGDTADVLAAISRRGLLFRLVRAGGEEETEGGGARTRSTPDAAGEMDGGLNTAGGIAGPAAGASWDTGGGPSVAFRSLSRGFGSQLVVQVAISPHLWDRLPPSLRGGGAAPLRPCARLIRCVVVLFSQGIDAKQSFAHAMGGAELQAAINRESLATLKWYAQAYRRESKLCRTTPCGKAAVLKRDAPATPPAVEGSIASDVGEAVDAAGCGAPDQHSSAAEPDGHGDAPKFCPYGGWPRPSHTDSPTTHADGVRGGGTLAPGAEAPARSVEALAASGDHSLPNMHAPPDASHPDMDASRPDMDASDIDASRPMMDASRPMTDASRPVLDECLLGRLLAEADVAAARSQTHKCVALIRSAEALVRALGGGRVTSCKSAKDRTSMAVTAEQAVLLVREHGMCPADAPPLADAMRSYGVRWHNMRKNVRGGTYAFNWLQRRLLPKTYRAPKGTFGGGCAT